jgi:hypothetical protein
LVRKTTIGEFSPKPPPLLKEPGAEHHLKPFDVGVLAFVVAKDRGKSPQSNLAIGTGASEMS